jgi:hypothetical protein
MPNNKRKPDRQTRFNPPQTVFINNQSSESHFLPTVLFAIFMSPLLFIGGVIVSYAVSLLQQNAKSWPIALLIVPFGITLIGTWIYQVWRIGFVIPSITISNVILKDRRLEIRTPRHGTIQLETRNVVACRVSTGKQGRLLGWWLRFEHYGWLYLPNQDENARRLIERIESNLEERRVS